MAEFAGIDQYIPHRGRMRLINRVVAHDADRTVTEALVLDAWPLARDGYVDSIMLIEVVAQTAAADVSLTELDGRQPEFGYMVGVIKAWFATPTVRVGAQLTATASTLRKSDNYAVILGVVREGNDVLHESQIQVFRVHSDTNGRTSSRG